jgi:hypothetical protein
MARVPIPSPDVPFLNADGTVARPWFEFLTAVDLLRIQDLAEFAQGVTPSGDDTIRYSAIDKNWKFDV